VSAVWDGTVIPHRVMVVVAGIASSCATSTRPAEVAPAPAPPAQPSAGSFVASVRPGRDATFTIGEPFSYWLELRNVSDRAIAVKSDFSIFFSYSQGEGGGGSGCVHWAPCRSETYLVGPGQTLTQLSWIQSARIDPGAAVLEFGVTIREAKSDGACAKREHEVEATMPVTVVPAKARPPTRKKK
jgi:hypothetical protein